MFASINISGIDQKNLYYRIKSLFELAEYESQIGLYSIHKNGICLYVGQSKNLPSRLATHLKGKYEKADEVRIYLAVNNGYRDIDSRSKNSITSILTNNEMMLIKKLKPIENIMVDFDFNVDTDKQFLYFHEEGYESHCAEIIIDGSQITFCDQATEPMEIINILMMDKSYLSENIFDALRHYISIMEQK